MHLLSRRRRTPRSGEWTAAAAVTFVVTLAASGIVTLAARAAGMSRKSAYALKARDPAFASAWAAALGARSAAPRQGDKVGEVDAPPVSSGQGDGAQRGARRRLSGAARRRAGRIAGLPRNPFLIQLAALRSVTEPPP